MIDAVKVKVPTRLADIERLMIEKTLKRNCGVLAATSRDLDISPSTLYRRLRDYRKKRRK
jgi:DNA-binding NtrC family response regulator